MARAMFVGGHLHGEALEMGAVFPVAMEAYHWDAVPAEALAEVDLEPRGASYSVTRYRRVEMVRAIADSEAMNPAWPEHSTLPVGGWAWVVSAFDQSDPDAQHQWRWYLYVAPGALEDPEHSDLFHGVQADV